MVLLRFPRGTMKPPMGAMLNPEHPFCHQLSFVIPFNEVGCIGANNAGDTFRSSILTLGAPSNTIINWGKPSTASAPFWTSNREGPCLVLDHLNAMGKFPGNLAFYMTSQITIAFVRRKRDTTLQGTPLLTTNEWSGAQTIELFYPFSDGNVYWRFGSSELSFSAGGALTNTNMQRGIVTAGPRGMNVWLNGVKIGSSATVPTRTFSPNAAAPVWLGNAASESGANIQELNWFQASATQWSDEMCRWWSAEPYAHVYSPVALRRFFFVNPSISGPTPPADGFVIYDNTVSPVDPVTREILQTWSISEALNERGTMRFGVKSMDGSYRPLIRQQVDFNWASQHFFAGFIHHTEEAGLGGYGVVPIVTQCGATDFNALPDRRQLAITLPAGTLKSMLELLEPYLTDYGVTLDPAQVDGPTLVELTFTLGPLTSVLNKLSLTSEYAWNIDYDKVLRMFAPGTEAAPFDIEDDDARVVGDVRVSPTTVDYANRIIVLAGTGTQDVSDPVGVGDGVEDTFELNYNVASLYGYVTNDVTNETLRVVGDPDAATWEYDPATNSITRLTGAPGVGDAITIPYTAQFPFEVIAEDVPAQEGGANLYERVYTHPEVFDAVTAQALADGYLVRSLVQPREIRYRTRLHGLHPGMQQQIQVTTRNVDGPCLITAVDISPEGSALYNYDITAVEGLTIVPSYQEAWRTLAGVSGN